MIDSRYSLYQKGDNMNIQNRTILIVLLISVSISYIGCAPKLTEEQALAKQQALKIKEEDLIAESQALSDLIKRYRSSLPVNSNIHAPKIPTLSPIRKIGNRTERLVVLSPRQSIKWIQALGLKITINERVQIIEGKNSYSYKSPGRIPIRLDEDADPQYIQFGNSRILITGTSYRSKPELFIIYDQFRNPRVITYQEY